MIFVCVLRSPTTRSNSYGPETIFVRYLREVLPIQVKSLRAPDSPLRIHPSRLSLLRENLQAEGEPEETSEDARQLKGRVGRSLETFRQVNDDSCIYTFTVMRAVMHYLLVKRLLRQFYANFFIN